MYPFMFLPLVLGLIVFLVVFIMAQDNSSSVTITCKTDGASLLQKSTKDGKYVTLWCVKNGVVVP